MAQARALLAEVRWRGADRADGRTRILAPVVPSWGTAPLEELTSEIYQTDRRVARGARKKARALCWGAKETRLPLSPGGNRVVLQLRERECKPRAHRRPYQGRWIRVAGAPLSLTAHQAVAIVGRTSSAMRGPGTWIPVLPGPRFSRRWRALGNRRKVSSLGSRPGPRLAAWRHVRSFRAGGGSTVVIGALCFTGV